MHGRNYFYVEHNVCWNMLKMKKHFLRKTYKMFSLKELTRAINWGQLFVGGNYLEGNHLGVVMGWQLSRWQLPRGNFSGGHCLRANCPGGNCPWGKLFGGLCIARKDEFQYVYLTKTVDNTKSNSIFNLNKVDLDKS